MNFCPYLSYKLCPTSDNKYSNIVKVHVALEVSFALKSWKSYEKTVEIRSVTLS